MEMPHSIQRSSELSIIYVVSKCWDHAHSEIKFLALELLGQTMHAFNAFEIYRQIVL